MSILYSKLILYFSLIFFYNLTIFSFIDTLLENRRTSKLAMIGMYLFNSFFFMSLFASSDRNSTVTYIIVILSLFLEIYILYKERILQIVFITLAVTMHIMSVRAITLAIFALIYNLTPYEINHSNHDINTLYVALSLLIVCNLLVKKFIPAKSVKIVQQHKEQLIFMTTWLIFGNLYFVFNSLVFTSINTVIFTKINIIAVSFTLLLSLYIVLIFTFKVGQLLNYKEKNDFLENVVEDGKQFRNSIADQAVIGFEANLTNDTILHVFGNGTQNIKSKNNYYSELLFSIPSHVHKDDIENVLQFMSAERLLDCYNRGKLEQKIEYRALEIKSKEYRWLEAYFNLYKASATDSVMVFSYAKDINSQKLLEIEIKNRSERDTLTGLYNHGMTKHLVNDFISSNVNNVNKEGALFIIDIDNFKLINDNLGHTFGDEVLQDISKKLLGMFRGVENTSSFRKDDDIVGRIGGDEFMVFVKTANVDVIKHRANSICELLKASYKTTDDEEIIISASVGIALVTWQDQDFKTLYAKADTALYDTKKTGKDGFSFYKGENFRRYAKKPEMV